MKKNLILDMKNFFMTLILKMKIGNFFLHTNIKFETTQIKSLLISENIEHEIHKMYNTSNSRFCYFLKNIDKCT